MEVTVGLVLLVVALILFALAAIGVQTGKINTVAAGLFFWALSTLF
jgi:hypothetical protein